MRRVGRQCIKLPLTMVTSLDKFYSWYNIEICSDEELVIHKKIIMHFMQMINVQVLTKLI